jgi:hypothetical protein
MARASRAGRMGNMPIDPNQLCAHSLKSGFFSKCTHPDGCAHPATSQPRTSSTQKFCADDVGLIASLEPFAQKLVGHQQVTDAYLLGLAIHKQGKLVTMDRGVRMLLPEKSPERDFVALI